jgi:hypothetical protein
MGSLVSHRTVTPIPSAERVAGRWDGSDGARPTGLNAVKKEAGSRRHRSVYGNLIYCRAHESAGHVGLRRLCAGEGEMHTWSVACRLDQCRQEARGCSADEGRPGRVASTTEVTRRRDASRSPDCADAASLHCVLCDTVYSCLIPIRSAKGSKLHAAHVPPCWVFGSGLVQDPLCHSLGGFRIFDCSSFSVQKRMPCWPALVL